MAFSKNSESATYNIAITINYSKEIAYYWSEFLGQFMEPGGQLNRSIIGSVVSFPLPATAGVCSWG